MFNSLVLSPRRRRSPAILSYRIGVDGRVSEKEFSAQEGLYHDARLAGKYNLFILKVVKAWVDASVKNPATFHHRGGPDFFIAGRTVQLRAKKAG
ncbi:MAG: flavin reductase-like protein [Elusimicrobia bacterium]|nr:MAG: flavin reductase-like protein [Elusimicrobiota bacterium]